jgi:iron complex transport system substrate-binding protein
MRDHLNREVALPTAPQRIVSLCPSITETLYDLGLGEKIVGRTRFCIHPMPAVKQATRVGGTKQINFERLHALQPDLIIAEKEENTPEMVARLAQDYPVFVTDVVDLPSALRMIRDLGQLTGSRTQADPLASRIEAGLVQLRGIWSPLRTLYLIWQNPYMGVGSPTYIHSLLTHLGLHNLLAGRQSRYPQLTLEAMQAIDPELLLLSSEPFPFDESHVAALSRHFPRAQVARVDGEMFSWYGSRMERAMGYLGSRGVGE